MKGLLATGAGIAVSALVAVGAVLALGGASDSDEPGQVRSEEDAGSGDALGVCIEGVTDCVDTVVGDDSRCAEDAYDCDEPVSGDPVTIIDDQDPNECSFVHNIDACEKQATGAALDNLSARLGIEAEVIAVTSATFTDWPNSCLGVESPNQICLQVITPGFKIVLEHGGTTYEYHTDTGTAAVLVE